MATRLLLRPLIRPQTIGLGLGISIYSAFQLRQRPIRLDSSPSSDSYRENAKTPLVRNGTLNPRAVRQISGGSIIGLCAGLVFGSFSKTLAIILGMLVVGVQLAESHFGIHIIPYDRLQRYFTSIDLRSAVQDNVGFKLAFGSTFALAGFLDF